MQEGSNQDSKISKEILENSHILWAVLSIITFSTLHGITETKPSIEVNLF